MLIETPAEEIRQLQRSGIVLFGPSAKTLVESNVVVT
jgi:hypothetical protein